MGKIDDAHSRNKHKPISPPRRSPGSNPTSKRNAKPSPPHRTGGSSVFHRLGGQRASRAPRRMDPRQPTKRDTLCRNYKDTGICPYGDRCIFIHKRIALTKQAHQKRRQDVQPSRRIVQDLNKDSPPKKRGKFATGDSPDGAIISRTAEFDEHMKLENKRKKLKEKISKLDKETDKPLEEKIKQIESEVRLGLHEVNLPLRPESRRSNGSNSTDSQSTNTTNASSNQIKEGKLKKTEKQPPPTPEKVENEVLKDSKHRSSSRDTSKSRDLQKGSDWLKTNIKVQSSQSKVTEGQNLREKERTKEQQVRYPAREIERRRRREAAKQGQETIDDSKLITPIKRTIHNTSGKDHPSRNDTPALVKSKLDAPAPTSSKKKEKQQKKDVSEPKRDGSRARSKTGIRSTQTERKTPTTDSAKPDSHKNRSRSFEKDSMKRKLEVDKDKLKSDKKDQRSRSRKSKEKIEKTRTTSSKEMKRNVSMSPENKIKSENKRSISRDKIKRVKREESPRGCSSEKLKLTDPLESEKVSQSEGVAIACLEEISEDENPEQESVSGDSINHEEEGSGVQPDWASLITEPQAVKQPVSSLRLRFAPHRFLRTVPFSPNLLGPELTNKIEDVCNSCPIDDQQLEPFKLHDACAAMHAAITARIRARQGAWQLGSCSLSASKDLAIRRGVYPVAPEYVSFGCTDENFTETPQIPMASISVAVNQKQKIETIHSPE